MERISLPLELFYCYAPQDLELLDRLNNHLASLRDSDRITTWCKEQILPGYDEEEETREHLKNAHIILLLVSPDFVASPSCIRQAKWAVERCDRGEIVRVIPIILRPVDVRSALFSRLKVLPSNGIPVTEWASRDAAFKDIAMGLGKVVKELQNRLGEDTGNNGEDGRVTIQAGQQRRGHLVLLPPTSGEQSEPESRPQSAPKPRLPRVTKKRMTLASLLAAIAAIFLLVLWILSHTLTPPTPHASTLIKIWKTPMGELVGLSDGRFAFDTDTNRADGSDKIQAAKAFASGDTATASALWQKAIQEDPGDAEALIYQEDQHVFASGRPYITLVVATILVATILTGQNAPIGRDDLQGAYVAQKEFNGSSHSFQVRLLIANSGTGDESVATTVAQQIVQVVSQDKTVIGVVGWPFSQSTVNAVKVLGPAHIPMVSETASTDDLTGVSPYFFRLVAPNFYQGEASAQYVTKNLHAKRVALFVDPHNAYSNSLANDFKQAYLSEGNGNSIVATEQYTVGIQGQAQLSTYLHDALNANPDAIYFSGYANDLSVLLNALPSSGLGASVPIVGGESFYELGAYNPSSRAHWPQLHFLSYAYPDEWEIAGLAGQKPRFFQEYSAAFNPSGQAAPGQYGFTRADNDVILSYDATWTLLTASASVGQNVTKDQLQQALKQIDDDHPLQGASGRIAFGPDGNPVNKPLLLMSVDLQNRLHEDKLLSGCLQADHCG